MRVPIRIPISAHTSSFAIPSESRPLRTRDQGKTSSISGIAVAAVAAGIVLIAAAYFGLRHLRIRHQKPKYIPTPFLKRLWTDWKVPKSRSGHRYQQPAENDDGADPARRGANHMRDARNNLRASLRDPSSTNPNTTAGATTEAGVDRNTSVRSVMTLPAYRLDASEHEQVLGREGERGGIDVVVEMPTAEDEEALREEEMETLYQIRLARRRQIEEREERRQRRREARARNDAVALEELRRARARGEDADATGSAEAVQELRREHDRIKETRQRAVSSVSYHEVGLVRADGTRLRANSNESERVGLLSDAASIAPSARSASGGSGLGLFGHRRDRSASSVISIDTAGNGHSPPGSPLLTTDSAGGNRSGGPTTPRAGSSPEMIDRAEAEADLGDADMPPHSPPGYDDVSLDELTPAHSRESRDSRSGANSPYNEPPPDYPGGGPTQMRNHRLSAQMAGLAASAATEGGEEEAEGSAGRRGSRGVGGVPQLPSLRLTSLPRIVVEPSTATPGEDER